MRNSDPRYLYMLDDLAGEGVTAWSEGTDAHILLAVLRAKTITRARPLNGADLNIWAGKHRLYSRLEDDAADTASLTRDYSKAALRSIETDGSLDATDQDVQDMLASLVTAGVISPAAAQDLSERATEAVPKYGSDVRAGDVQYALTHQDEIRSLHA